MSTQAHRTALALLAPALAGLIFAQSARSNPAGSETDLAAAIERATSERGHEAVYQVGTPLEGVPAAWQAPNHAQDLRVFFVEDGATFEPRVAPAEGWRASLRLESLARGEARELMAPGQVEACGTRVEIRRPGVTEWYLNDERGFEQGFDLAERFAPSERGPVELLVAVDGLRLGEVDATNATLADADGRTTLRLSGLVTRDAAGRELPSRFERRGERLAYVVEDAGAEYPIVVDPLITHERARLDARDRVAPGAEFGTSVSLSGHTALVCAPAHELAYVFRRFGSTWQLDAKLTNPGDPGNGFAAAGGISPTHVALGAPEQEYLDVPRTGVVYAFEIDADHSEYELVNTLHPTPLHTDAKFGVTIQLTYYRLYVGAPGADASGVNSGEVYLFDADDGFALEQRLAPIGSFPGARFGSSLSFGSGLGAVGAPSQLTGVTSTGAVWCWKWQQSDGLYHYAQTLTLPNSDGYGRAVSASTNLIAVGTPSDHNGGAYRGSVRVFKENEVDGTFHLQTQLLGMQPGDELGASVVIARFATSGGISRLVAGAPGADGESGEVLVFDSMNQSSWYSNTVFEDLGEPGARYGTSAVLQGASLLVGGPTAANGGWTSGAVLAFDLDDPDGEPGRLIPLDLGELDQLGHSVEIDGDLAVAGAPGDVDGGGSAFVFRRTAGEWGLEAKLRGAMGHAGDRFGGSVDVEGDRVVVGAASTLLPDGTDCGVAYVFENSPPDGWALKDTLVPANPISYQEYGNRVSLSQDRVACFAWRGGGAALDEPLVDFWRAGNPWLLEDEVVLSAVDGYETPFTIDLDGDRLAVSCLFGGADGRGEVRLIDRNGADWSFADDVPAPGDDPAPYFGWALDLEGDLMAIGAPFSADLRGEAFLFRRHQVSGAWELDSSFLADDSDAGDRFGSAVAVDGETVVVGAESGGPGGGQGEGRAYVFQRTGSTWTQRNLVPFEPTERMGLGSSIALSGTYALVGAPRHGEGQGGSALLFELDPPSPFHAFAPGDGSLHDCPCGNESEPWSGQGCTNSTGLGARMTGIGTASIAANDMRLELENVRPNQWCVLFSADVLIAPVPYGDGLVSMTGWVERLQPRVTDGSGRASWNDLLDTYPWPAGSQRLFQTWYRDPLNSPCGNGFNLSNGISVILEP